MSQRNGNLKNQLTRDHDATSVIRAVLAQGVAERGKETNTHFFFFADLADPYLPNIVCFPSSNVFFECFLVI